MLHVCTIGRSDENWVLDSSMSFHMSPNIRRFSDFSILDGGFVKHENNESCHIKGIGNILLKSKNGHHLMLRHIRYVLALKGNLISLRALDDEKYHIEIKNGFTNIFRDQKLIVSSPQINGIYVIGAQSVSPNSCISFVAYSDKSELWHKRLGHLSENGLKSLSYQGDFGSDSVQKLTFCGYCIIATQVRLPFRARTHKSQDMLKYIHSDLWGPARTPTVSS